MATKTSTGEGVLSPPHSYGSQHPWTWRSIILSFGYIPRSTSTPLQTKANFLSTFSWTPSHFKGHPHPSASHLQPLFPFLMCRGKAPRTTSLAISRSQLCSQAYKTCQLPKQAIIQWTALCHTWLIPFTIILPFTSIYFLHCYPLSQVKIKFLEPF